MSFEAIGLRETRAWLAGRLKGLPEAVRFAITSPIALDFAKDEATRIVNEVVYQAYQPEVYKRTYNLLNAVEAVALDENSAGVMIPFSDLLAATKGPLAGAATYAQLMLPEFIESSYWEEKPRQSLPRDFLSAWMFEFKELAFINMRDEIDLEIGA
ncbi:MAG: hypothetical protein KIS92_22455 [Planctomycetota bacterium]|nr:hypothetical protein [Planctomycetota bacterium]